MDKSKLSPAVQPFVPKVQQEGRLEPPKQLTTSSPPLTLPNPYLLEQGSRRNQAGKATSGDDSRKSPRQRPSTTDGMRGETPSKHGNISSRRTKGTTETSAYTAGERPIRVQQTKASKSSSEFASQNNNMIRRSLDAPRRGVFRGSRSAPNSSARSKLAQVDFVTFEVKMAEFPELGGVAPGSPALPVPQKPGTCWGSASPSLTPHHQSSVSTSKTTPVRKGQRQDLSRFTPSSENSDTSLTVAQGQPVEAVSHNSGLAVTSWANVASQPPKKVIPKETVNNSTPSQKEETAVQQEEQASEKKKRKKKKKKKSKMLGEGGAVEESEDLVIYQEPPKFEDEEEFPDLSLAFAGSARVQGYNSVLFSNMAKLVKKEEGHRVGTGLQPGDQNKEKATAGKAQPAETKKGQKAEKTSGKKSKVPVQLDIGNMLAVLEKKQQTQKDKQDTKGVILSVGGSLPVGHKNALIQKKPWLQDKIAHNPLDSTSPLVKKGKQREVPKAKKPTPLKRVILKEREHRKQNRLLEERALPPSSEESKMAGNMTEELCEAIGIDQDPRDSTDVSSSPTSSSVLEEEQSEVHEETRAADGETRAADGETEEETEKDTEEIEEPTNQSQPQPCPPIRPKIHSRKFRDYCSQVLSKDVDEYVTNLLKELVRFQDRLYQKDPMKARMKRRLVMGLREVLKHLKLRKVKCVVISPNCERIQSKGGLDEALHTIIDTCREQGVPFVFALSRKALGRCVNKAVPVSLVGIFNYDGAQDHYHKMIELSSEARRAYEVMIENLELTSQGEQENQEDQLSTGPLPPPPACSEAPEPEYIKLWKKMLEKECNHKFLNFEEQFSSVPRASDCKEQMDEDEKS
ncbi:selenocysteine insertion sequence-binding protein 2 isoform X2 [Coregonus clupeaformis]|uniref:selenocysteine insertion sequence-binding protein 2 isoform X2 n=1 Tax=Coregonus clupeaformis TaxID=59861 RepID=UPI001BE0E3CA|nr:selenocysteine insertion sequence-binding protein 2 isoform X2 [Coregonus clupeaformis]